MAVIKMKPTSPGQRQVVKVSRDHLYKGDPYAPLLEKKFGRSVGRRDNVRKAYVTLQPGQELNFSGETA
jgi:ribosomal protein L2